MPGPVTVGVGRESTVRIAYGADDENETTRAVVGYLSGQGHEVVPVTASDKWPDIGQAVGQAVATGAVDYGVVMCWTGTGTAIAANKVPGVRAALAWEPWIARGARLWNDANVVALSLKRLAPDVAVEVVQAFLGTPEPDADEAANIARIAEIESRF
jgi:ribose 5-phosphate isomerase B